MNLKTMRLEPWIFLLAIPDKGNRIVHCMPSENPQKLSGKLWVSYLIWWFLFCTTNKCPRKVKNSHWSLESSFFLHSLQFSVNEQVMWGQPRWISRVIAKAAGLRYTSAFCECNGKFHKCCPTLVFVVLGGTRSVQELIRAVLFRSCCCWAESCDVLAGGGHVTLAGITWPATDVTPSLITTPRLTC